MSIETTIQNLRDLLGDRLETDSEVLELHSHDVSHHEPQRPAAVVFPVSNVEVSEVVRLCAAARVPLIPFGTGTAVEGGVVATCGGITVDLSRMNQILDVQVADMDATVQAGVTRYQLNNHLGDLSCGLIFPVDPGADASLGGMAATCASGSSAVRYGTMRHNVLGLTVVLADGRVIRVGGRAPKSVAGYDLTRLLVGSEGTLGIITEVTLRLIRPPAAISSAVCAFPDVDAAVKSVIEIRQAGIPMARIELLDDKQIEASNRYSNLNHRVAPTLFFEFHGSSQAVAEQAEGVAEIVRNHGGDGFAWATAREDRDRLWQARYDCYYAALAMRKGGSGYVTDVCVPISRLAECIGHAQDLVRSTTIPATILGHVGDGNFHVVFVIDPHSKTEVELATSFSDQIASKALSVGGTCTGEHGVGLGKVGLLEQECGDAVDVMRCIKTALDPHGLMNPGKVLRTTSD